MKKNISYVFKFLPSLAFCFIFVLFLQYADDSFAISKNKFASPIDLPVKINDDATNIKVYKIDGMPYLPLKDISDNTKLMVYWVPDKNKVVIRDSSAIVLKKINGGSHVDMHSWYSKYNSYHDINGKPSSDVIPYTFDYSSLWHHEHELVCGVPMSKSLGFYVEQEIFFEYIYPLFGNIIKENEAVFNSMKVKKEPFINPYDNYFAIGKNKTAIPAKYSIEINGDATNIKTYTIDGRTYISIKDLSENTNIVDPSWLDESDIDITDGSFIVIKKINGKSYVDMSYWFNRYKPDQIVNGKIAKDALPYTLDNKAIMHGTNLVANIPMENLNLFGWYIEQEYFFEKVYPLLGNVIKENEAVYNYFKKDTIMKIYGP
ncbi:MAG: hypothetical protein ACRDA4_01670 [Filifactoraceae bacterium]